MKMIDPHVHLRDWNQAHKETLLHAFGVAWKCGISALFEMPNTDPPLTTRTTVLRRLADADRALAKLRSKQFHGLYVGLTADPEQIRAAVELHQEFFPRVVGFKLYAGHSTGRMGVTTVAGQYQVWRSISSAGYHGVVALHAEREDLLRPDLRVLSDPRTHCGPPADHRDGPRMARPLSPGGRIQALRGALHRQYGGDIGGTAAGCLANPRPGELPRGGGRPFRA